MHDHDIAIDFDIDQISIGSIDPSSVKLEFLSLPTILYIINLDRAHMTCMVIIVLH